MNFGTTNPKFAHDIRVYVEKTMIWDISFCEFTSHMLTEVKAKDIGIKNFRNNSLLAHCDIFTNIYLQVL